MADVGTQLAGSPSEAGQATDQDDKAAAEASKQRRKVQNRMNQRARRLRLKGGDAGNLQKSRPFQVKRWRLDEPNHIPSQEVSPAYERATATSFSHGPPHTDARISASVAKRTLMRQEPLSMTTHHQAPVKSDIQPASFPFPSDHLLHLIQYNVCRALITNMRTLNTVPATLTTCTVASPCRDDTMRYPLRPDMPDSLIPTVFQQTHNHSAWINVIPFPRVRENLIRYEGRFDAWELLQDLVGDLLNSTPDPRQRQAYPFVKNPQTPPPRTLLPGSDPDEVTAGRKGLIVWGEPYEMKNWEATPGFLAKWAWVADGCHELVEISNYWRMKRGRNRYDLRCSGAKSPPTLPHTASSGGERVKFEIYENYVSPLQIATLWFCKRKGDSFLLCSPIEPDMFSTLAAEADKKQSDRNNDMILRHHYYSHLHLTWRY